MEVNISSWLKDHLGLTHMSEADLNSLMFHPRHGSLCRRFVNFIASSTLCSQKYPNVHAQQEYLAAKETLENQKSCLHQALVDLERLVRENENDERYLCCLNSRLEYLKELHQTQENSMKALEEIAASPNLIIEQVVRNIGDADYMSNSDLEAIYSGDPAETVASTAWTSLDGPVSERQMALIDEEFKSLKAQIELLHKVVNRVLNSVHGKLELMLPLRKRVDLPTKVPDSEEQVTTQPDFKAFELRKHLTDSLLQTQAEVARMSEQYRSRKESLNRVYVGKLNAYLASLEELIKMNQ